MATGGGGGGRSAIDAVNDDLSGDVRADGGSGLEGGGDGASGTRGPADLTGLKTVRGHNEIYVFALPDAR